MEIVGDGMIARAFTGLINEVPEVLLFASGVSRSSLTSEAELQREADLLYEMVRKARAEGRRIVYFSTASPHLYGWRGSGCAEDSPIYPCTAYGRHKAAMETVIRGSRADYLILRLSEVVGPYQRPYQLLPALAAQVATGEVTVYRGARRDLIDVADVVRVTAELLGAGQDGPAALAGGTVNVASGHSAAAEEIIDHLILRAGHPVAKTYVDASADRCLVCTDLMIARAPVASRLGFSPAYYRSVIDRYYC